jgi:hypothetical protein
MNPVGFGLKQKPQESSNTENCAPRRKHKELQSDLGKTAPHAQINELWYHVRKMTLFISNFLT